MIVILVAIAVVGGFLLGCVVTVLVLFIAAIIYEETSDTRSQQPPPHKASNPSRKTPKHLTRLTTEDSRHLSPAGTPSQVPFAQTATDR